MTYPKRWPLWTRPLNHPPRLTYWNRTPNAMTWGGGDLGKRLGLGEAWKVGLLWWAQCPERNRRGQFTLALAVRRRSEKTAVQSPGRECPWNTTCWLPDLGTWPLEPRRVNVCRVDLPVAAGGILAWRPSRLMQWLFMGCHYLTMSVSHSVMSTLCDPMDCSPPGSSVRGILQARILEWAAIPFSRRSSQPRVWTQVSRIAGKFLTIWGMAYHQGSLVF